MERREKKGFFGVIQCRYILALLGAIGMAIVYGLKVNLSIAIVTMVNHTAQFDNTSEHSHKGSDACVFDHSEEAETVKVDGPFLWSATLQGIILSSYFWGYLISLIPGGIIAEFFSAKWVMFFAVAINTICTLLTPISAKLHHAVLIAMRVGEGIGGGVTFPAMHCLLARWSLPNQRTIMSSVVYAGTSLGTVLSTLLAGIIADNINWEAVFYIMGGLSAIWWVLWIFLISDNPNKSRIITNKEKELINEALGQVGEHNKPNFPAKSVFTSLPFWAILVAHTCSNWGWYMVLIELPLYMRDILQLDVAETSQYISLAFFLMWVFSLLFSHTLDHLRSKGKINTTWARKIATLVSSAIPLGCFIALCFIGCSRLFAIILTIVAIVTIAGMFSGFLSNHIDIAPNFAGTLVAITNTVATIPGIVVPLFAGALMEIDPGMFSWRIIFFTTAGLYVLEIVVYTIFASGNEQSWNKTD